ncbi:MAG: hypothetical protein ACRD12_03785, partial [Acidimicrobiales bacterium]
RAQVAVYAARPTTAGDEADLARLGADRIRSLRRPGGLELPDVGLIEAYIPRGQLAAAAKLPWVTAVRPAGVGHAKAVTSQGVALHNAAALHAAGITGQGVKVGVISEGAQSLLLAQLFGELPPVTVVDQATYGLGVGDEGTAMLEIVHDMAPGAGLFFHAAGLEPDNFVTTVTFVNAMIALAEVGANIIVHDLGFLDEPLFQEGIVAAVSDALSEAGVSVHAAAGNEATTHAARQPAVGSGNGPDGDDGPFVACEGVDNAVPVAPGGDTTFDITLLPNQFAAFVLQWSEPRAVFPTEGWGGFTDLDLYLMDEGLTECLAVSDDVQFDGLGDSFEGFFGMSPFPVPTRAKLVVNLFDTSTAVAPPVFDLKWIGAAAVDTPTAQSSLDGVVNFTSGLAAAAGAVNPATGQLEPFSSHGPVDLRLTTACPPGTVKGFEETCEAVAGPPPETFPGPAWVAADRVTTSGIGGFGVPFVGTSASAPHAAGCDALVRQALGNPASPVGPVHNRLAGSARDLPPPGPDDGSGAGILDCTAAVASAALALSAGPGGVVSPGTTATANLTVTNNGPDNVSDEVFVSLPGGFTFQSSPSGCTPGKDPAGQPAIFCPLGALSVNQSRQFTVEALVAEDLAPGTYTVRGRLISPFDTSAGDNEVTITFTVSAPLPATGAAPLMAAGIGLLVVAIALRRLVAWRL